MDNPYDSVDPAPPLSETSVARLSERLMDTSRPMFQRMRALFALRNIGGQAAIDALAKSFGDPSALLRHEVAYVLGQMQDPHAIAHLSRVLVEDRHVMVRHEAAEALGAIGDAAARPLLERFRLDPAPEVAESCEVALDLLDYMASKELEYVDA